MHAYKGERPANVAAFYQNTRLIGYGNASLASLFRAWDCADVQPHLPGGREGRTEDETVAAAVRQLTEAPRYVVASRLLRLLFPPPALPAEWPSRFAVAVHLRRGDKMTEERNSERINIWDEPKVVAAVQSLLTPKPSVGRAAPSTGASGSAPAVLLASDDNAFAARVEAALKTSLPHVTVHRPLNAFDPLQATTSAADGSGAAVTPNSSPTYGPRADGARYTSFDICDARCVPPLRALAGGFAVADGLIISTKSNMGSFLLSYWGAGNNDVAPPVRRIVPPVLHREGRQSHILATPD